MSTVKCLVWDLDETLWRGILVENGDVRPVDGVRAVVEELDRRGILQAVASKNDFDPAWERLESLGLAEYFVLAEIGWGPKSGSVRAIAQRLSFAEGTIAFIDDQPAERAEVAYHLPDVRCYPAEEATTLVDLPEFTPSSVTVDSANRREMYRANIRRDAERADFVGPDEDFLRTMGLDLRIVRATESELLRVEELTRRTSQMNATGVHYSAEDLRGLVADPAHEVLVATPEDRFGSHGAIGVLLLRKHPSAWHVKLLATSCRVVSFGVGAAMLGRLGSEAAAAGVHLLADLRRTDRNRIMEIAYRFAGFGESGCGCRQEADAPGVDGVQLLHLEPQHREPPSTMRLAAPALAGG